MNILEPTHGNAEVLGVDSRKISRRELCQIGYVSENQDMPEKLTVEEFLAYLQPFYPTWDTALEKSILSQLRLPLERKIRDLSHGMRSEEHTSELQSRGHLVCRLLLEKKKKR